MNREPEADDVFIVKDCLIAPWVPSIRFAIIVIFVNCPQVQCVHKYAYEQISNLVEHDYEVIRYKTPDVLIDEGYFPFSGHPEIIDVVPGTHASGSFLAYLVFNKYVLDTPLYREMYRLPGEAMVLKLL